MNVFLDHINVHLMPHAETLLAHTPAPAILAMLGMEELVWILMNVLMHPIYVHLMLHVRTQMAHILVPVILATLEMD